MEQLHMGERSTHYDFIRSGPKEWHRLSKGTRARGDRKLGRRKDLIATRSPKKRDLRRFIRRYRISQGDLRSPSNTRKVRRHKGHRHKVHTRVSQCARRGVQRGGATRARAARSRCAGVCMWCVGACPHLRPRQLVHRPGHIDLLCHAQQAGRDCTQSRPAAKLDRCGPHLVNTTPQMTCFRGAKVCNKWLQERIDHNIQPDNKFTIDTTDTNDDMTTATDFHTEHINTNT